MKVYYSWVTEVEKNEEHQWPSVVMKLFEEQPYYDKVSKYHSAGNKYHTIPVIVSLYEDGPALTKMDSIAYERLRFQFRIDPLYTQCCGLREIGNFAVYNGHKYPVDAKEIVNTICDDFKYGALTECVGALTYTLVKDGFGNFNEPTAALIMQAWPGASAGDWWYNPNSGNHVQIWTLPINQDRQNALEDDDEQEEED